MVTFGQVWMNVGDVILLSLREFQDAKEILLKYTADEARSLKSLGEIPETGILASITLPQML